MNNLKSGDKFRYKNGSIFTLFNLASIAGKDFLSYDIDCWILVNKHSRGHQQWCAVDEGNTALGAFGGHEKDFTKVE